MVSREKICAVIPAYNCAATLPRTISGVREQGLRVLVVDDGSADDTAGAALRAGAEVVRHEKNRGKGHALITAFGWALARGLDYVATLDADGQHDPADLPLLLECCEAADLVIGQRQLDRELMPPSSFAGNCISTFFISVFCGKAFPDTQCGFRIYSRRLLTRVPLRGGRFETETEVLMRASLLGLRIDWVPVQTIYSNGITPHRTNFNNVSDTLRVIGVVLRSTRFPRKGR